MWSAWKCEIRIVSMLFGSIPAAARLASHVPDCGAMRVNCPPVPVSIRTSFLPVLTTSVVNGVGSLSVGWKEFASAFCTSANGALRTNFSSIVAKPRAVVDRGHFKVADLVAIEGGGLFAARGAAARAVVKAGAAVAAAARAGLARNTRRLIWTHGDLPVI